MLKQVIKLKHFYFSLPSTFEQIAQQT
jgi:hypothetical protein